MGASFAPTSRGGVSLCNTGRMCRYDKPLAGVWHRWKCAKYDRGFKCNGFDLANGEGPGKSPSELGIAMNTASQAPPKWRPSLLAAILSLELAGWMV